MRDDDVREGRREYKVGARAKGDRREHRHNPVHAAIRRERQPEERDGYKHATDLPHPESELRRRLFLAVSVLVFAIPPWGSCQFFFNSDRLKGVRTGSSTVECTSRGACLSPFRGMSGLWTAC